MKIDLGIFIEIVSYRGENISCFWEFVEIYWMGMFFFKNPQRQPESWIYQADQVPGPIFLSPKKPDL